MPLKGKKILLGISAGIAAYKCCDLTRLFVRAGAEVRVVMTPSAVKFVSPITLSALSGNEVLINMFPEGNIAEKEKIDIKTWHIFNGLWADIFIIAPATANTVAKITYGLCDNFLTSVVLASRCPVIVCPSMDEDMYNNKATDFNLAKLKERGYYIIEPESGELASGLIGKGRLPEPSSIYTYVADFLQGMKKDYNGKKILVTAGPTYEPIDDVRYIGNYSSGKMGFQIARAAAQRGADVTLISGPSNLETPAGVKRLDVITSDEMFEKVKVSMAKCDFIIMSAAVSDYQPITRFSGKLKKDEPEFELRLKKTNDILDYLGKNKTNFKLIGFALETVNESENAKKKLISKNLDLIVLNNPNVEGAGFGSDTNVVTFIDKELNITILEKMHKIAIAEKLLDKILTI
jgi:phosphopantothenoylcysteine decarboxylase/phosphopantothenate--cysteine ligase